MSFVVLVYFIIKIASYMGLKIDKCYVIASFSKKIIYPMSNTGLMFITKTFSGSVVLEGLSVRRCLSDSKPLRIRLDIIFEGQLTN